MTLKALFSLIGLALLAGCADTAYQPDYIITKDEPSVTEEPSQKELR